MNSTEDLYSAARIDVSDVVRLRRRVSRAATSLKVIGFVSAVIVLIWSGDDLGFVIALLCAMLIFGLANATAMRLRAGSYRAAGLAAVWGLLWCALFAFDALPKSLKNGFDLWSILGSLIFCLTLLFLASGLVALVRYRPAATGEDVYLLAHPWEEGLRIKVRPHLLRMNIGAVLLIVLSPLPYFFLWASQLVQEQSTYNSEAERLGALLAASAFALGTVAWGAKIYRRARRKAMLPGSALVKKDPRAIVLYLRSFQDDAAFSMRARATNGRILPERLVRISFEEVVTDHLWGYGPVLAIGDPHAKDKDAPLGAARDYVADADWQNQVAELMRRASLVIAIAAKTTGLTWELDAVVKHGFLSKFVLLLPPADSKELEARLQGLASKTACFSFPSRVAHDRLRAVIFPKGHATLINGDERNDWTYEAALDQAALSILGSPHSQPTTSPQPVASAGELLRRLLPTLSVFAGSALAFSAIGALFLLGYGANLIRSQSSHPFAHSGSDRDDFVTLISEGCRKEHIDLAEEALSTYCSCFANRIADAVTNGEVEALADSKSVVIASVTDLKASFSAKVNAAAEACVRTLR